MFGIPFSQGAPPWISIAILLGGYLLSAFAGRLPDRLQDIGLVLGIVLIVMGIGGLILHLAAQARVRGGNMLPVIGMAISAVAFLGCGIWYYLEHGSHVTDANTAQVSAPAVSAPPPVQSQGSTGIRADGVTNLRMEGNKFLNVDNPMVITNSQDVTAKDNLAVMPPKAKDPPGGGGAK